MKHCKVIGISFILLSLMFVGASNAAIDPETCVGLWLFDEGTGDTAADSSGNNNHGTLMNEPTWVDGKFGGALEFDGEDDYVEVADADSLKMTSEITVAFWFRTGKQMVEFGDRQAVVGKHYLEYEVGIYPNGGVHTYTSDGADGYDEGINCSIAEEFPEDDWTLDEWYHLAWTLNGNHEVVYVNGVNVGEFDKANSDTKPGDHTLEIGRRQGGSLPFTGAIDEVAVFNVALGEDGIKAIMEQGLKGAVLVAVFPSGKLTTTWGQVRSGK